MNVFDTTRKGIQSDRKSKYRGFWDVCPIDILLAHIAFKALRSTFIFNVEKLKEEMCDIANYAEKAFTRAEEIEK